MLAFFTTGGDRPLSVRAGRDARLGANAAAQGYSFVATSDWDVLSDVGLKDVRLVIWLNDQPHTPAQRDAFQRYMDGGGAWLGFHVSGFSSNAWPWYATTSSAAAASSPATGPRCRAGSMSMIRAPHGEERAGDFRRADQRMVFVGPQPAHEPDVKVLLTLDKSNFPMGVKNMLNGGDIPVAWTNTRYRMLYLNYGHGDRIYSRARSCRR